jgi:protocatechuate 3,4-dioxygenase beta subunit
VHHERDDAPIEGLPVELVFERGGAAESLERTTDAAGRVRFHLDPGDAPSRVSVLATAITTPATKWLGGGPRSGEVEVRLVVSGGHRLEGRVVDENGAPVVGATVTGWCGSDLAGSTARTTRTDADGRFALEHLGPEFVVTARAADRECADGLRGTLTRDVVGAEAETLELRLGPAVEIAGVVVTPAGEVVAGAEVEARSGLDTSTSTDVTAVPGVTHFHPANSASARSDAHGRFTLTGLTGGVRAVFATSPPYLVTRAELSAGAAGNRLVLDAGLALRGRVVDASGRPAAGATVRFWPYWGNVQTTPSKVLTDAAGEFRLLGWSREGNHGIGVVYAGHAIQVVQPVFPGPDGGEPVLVELEPEGVIAGVVLDGERRPVPDASVRVEGTREVDVGARFTRRSTWEWRLGVDETRTDALGRFRFDRLYDGDFVVHVVPAGDAALGQDVRARTGEEALEVVLDARAMRKVAFVGRVVDARSRAPIERFTVTPMIAGSGRNHEFEDEQGRFELAGLPEGPIEVVVEAEGYARFATAVREYRAGTHELRPALEEARSLELRITDSRGESIPSGGVRVRAPGGNRVGIREAAGISDRLSFEAGVAHLHGLPARPLEVVLDVPGAAETQVDVDLTFARREPLHVVVDPEPQVEVTLLVLGGSDQGASGATFEAELRRRLALPQSEENERWLREALSEAWRTRLCSSVRVEFEVPDGSRGATVEVTPAAESDYEVVVLTRDSLGNAQSNRGVRPQPFGSLRLSARRWTLRVTADGYRPVERELDLSTALDGDRRTEPLVLLPR